VLAADILPRQPKSSLAHIARAYELKARHPPRGSRGVSPHAAGALWRLEPRGATLDDA